MTSLRFAALIRGPRRISVSCGAPTRCTRIPLAARPVSSNRPPAWWSAGAGGGPSAGGGHAGLPRRLQRNPATPAPLGTRHRTRTPGLFSPRRTYALARGLLEVPTSCLLLPAASPTLLTLRRRGRGPSSAPAASGRRGICQNSVACVQFHVSDFTPDAEPSPHTEGHARRGQFSAAAQTADYGSRCFSANATSGKSARSRKR